MNPFQFLQSVGRKVANNVAVTAGTSPAYFAQIAYGHRHANYELAKRLADASRHHVRRKSQAMTVIAILEHSRDDVPAEARKRRSRRPKHNTKASTVTA